MEVENTSSLTQSDCLHPAETADSDMKTGDNVESSKCAPEDCCASPTVTGSHKSIDSPFQDLHDNLDDDDEDDLAQLDNEMNYVPPDPFKLKERGNELFKSGKNLKAIEKYKEALKHALKYSVRNPTTEIVELQMVCRKNLAAAFIKEEDYAMAKSHLEVVLDVHPEDTKALFRMAEVYLAMMDPDGAFEFVSKLLKIDPNNKAHQDIAVRVQHERREQQLNERNVLKTIFKPEALEYDKDGLEVEKEYTERTGVEFFDWKSHENILGKKEGHKDGEEKIKDENENFENIENLISAVMDWKDDPTVRLHMWNNWHLGQELRKDKTIIYLSAPLTVLTCLESLMMTKNMWHVYEQDENKIPKIIRMPFDKPADDNILIPSSKVFNPLIPNQWNKKWISNDLQIDSSPVDSAISKELRRRMTLALTRHCCKWSVHKKEICKIERPTTIHVIGAKGDEMEAKWSCLLDKLPCLDFLQIVLIGFTDPGDSWGGRLGPEGYFSPPLAKPNPKRAGQKLICRLFKGTYPQFIQSQDDETAKEYGLPYIKESGGILQNEKHQLHPDAACFLHPNFSRNFQNIVPAICLLLLSDIPICFSGYSGVDRPTHEAISIPTVLHKLSARTVVPLFWNIYSVLFETKTELPPMPLYKGPNEPPEFYSGPTATHAVSMVVLGCRDPVLVEKLAHSTGKEFLSDFQKECEMDGLDVCSESRAREKYVEDLKTESEARKKDIEEKNDMS